jgi:hypothetical protein
MKRNSIRPRLSRRRMLVAGSAGAAAGVGALNLAGPAASQAGGEVDLILVLAVDCSYSVDSREFRLQMDGIGHAFQHKDVQRAIQSGPLGRIAVTVFQWSDAENQSLSTPWTVIDSPATANAFGNKMFTVNPAATVGRRHRHRCGFAVRRSCSWWLLRSPRNRRVIDVARRTDATIAAKSSIWRATR